MPDEKKDSHVSKTETESNLMETADQALKKEKKSIFKRDYSSREKVIIRLALAAVLFMIVDLSIFKPISGYLDRLNDKIESQEQLIPKRLMILKHRDKILKEYNALQSLVTDPKITQEEEIAKFLREIERVSKGVGLFVNNINPVKVAKESEAVYLMSVDIDGKGGLKEIRRFIRMIEDQNPSMRVDGFDIKPDGKDSDQLKYRFSISKIGVKKDPALSPSR